MFYKIKNFWNSLTRKRKIFYSISLFLVLFIFLSPIFVYAGLDDIILKFFAGILKTLAYGIGWIAAVLMRVLVFFATWDKFVSGITAVDEGFEIARNMCNMFFILILMVISFATVVGVESYSYKKWLAKIIIFAILINFARTITGLLIDFSQVVMLTFVYGFKDATINNIAKGMHLEKIMSMNSNLGASAVGTETESVSGFDIFIVMLLVCIMLSVLCVVLVIMITMLIGRIVTLWILVILSPFAFLLQASPFGAKYANEWWQGLSKNIISGPIFAMFLYLALATIHESIDTSISKELTDGSHTVDDVLSTKFSSGRSSGAATGDGGREVFAIQDTSMILDFIIVIALLIAAIRIAGSLGVMGSSFAGQMSNKLQNAGSRPFKAVANWGNKAVTGIAKGASGAVGRSARKAGIGTLGFVTGGRHTSVGRTFRAWNKDLDQSRNDKVRERRKKMYDKLGIGKKAQYEIATTLNKPKMRAVGNIVKGAGSGLAAGSVLGVPGIILGAIGGGVMGYKNRKKQLRMQQAAALGSTEVDRSKKFINKISDPKQIGEPKGRWNVAGKDGRVPAWIVEAFTNLGKGKDGKEQLNNILKDLMADPKIVEDPLKREPEEKLNDPGEFKKKKPVKLEKPTLAKKEPIKPKGEDNGSKEWQIYHAQKAEYDEASSQYLKDIQDFPEKEKQYEENMRQYEIDYQEHQENTRAYKENKKKWEDYEKDNKEREKNNERRRSEAISIRSDNANEFMTILQTIKSNAPDKWTPELEEAMQTIGSLSNKPEYRTVQEPEQYEKIVPLAQENYWRKTNQGELSEERGNTSINGFIREGDAHRNRIGVDFREIEEEMKQIDPNFEANAEGININGKESVSKISSALNRVLDKELQDIERQLNEGTANGTLNDSTLKHLGQRQSDLIDAKKKISSGDVESLNLINSGMSNKHYKDTMIHEDLHDKSGMKNEEHTESLAQFIKTNNLSSLTQQLGEIAKKYDDSKDFDPVKILEELQQQGGSNERVDSVLEKLKAAKLEQSQELPQDKEVGDKEELPQDKEIENEPGSDNKDNKPESESGSTKSQLDQRSVSAIENLTKAVKKQTSVIQEDSVNRKVSEAQERPYKIADRKAMRENIDAVSGNTREVKKSTNKTEQIVTIEYDKRKETELENRVKDKENI